MASLKDISRYNSETVSIIVAQSIQKDGLDTTKCILWVTDNTVYMTSNKKGGVAFLIKKTGSNAHRIGCGFYIMQIILNHFEQEAFGKLFNSIGFSRKLHPYNLLYWHGIYIMAINLNASIIKDLYDKLMDFIITSTDCLFILIVIMNYE
ncbi:16324_t:CDS:1 [Funneliformis geosporum]|uniref:16324_t:CDS:1 n=1 Tax=Funneliformis geosporum TaxID=1117311 RepID=A0A9W4T5H8_9GLOM|nr:16324_t:CDS:1 [Funneliformis geosporum]